MTNARVEPDRRLVEEQHLRLRDECASDLEPPALAAAVTSDRPVQQLGQTERLGELTDAAAGHRGVGAPESRMDVEVAPPGERAVDDRFLEDDAADAPGCERLARNVVAGHACAAAREGDRRGEHADGGRLARSVRAEEAKHFPGRHLEIDALHGVDAAGVGLPQLAHADRRLLDSWNGLGSRLHWFLLVQVDGRHIGRL